MNFAGFQRMPAGLPISSGHFTASQMREQSLNDELKGKLAYAAS
jgi:hypothetical protein